jgi:hypothetical protein
MMRKHRHIIQLFSPTKLFFVLTHWIKLSVKNGGWRKIQAYFADLRIALQSFSGGCPLQSMSVFVAASQVIPRFRQVWETQVYLQIV